MLVLAWGTGQGSVASTSNRAELLLHSLCLLYKAAQYQYHCMSLPPCPWQLLYLLPVIFASEHCQPQQAGAELLPFLAECRVPSPGQPVLVEDLEASGLGRGDKYGWCRRKGMKKRRWSSHQSFVEETAYRRRSDCGMSRALHLSKKAGDDVRNDKPKLIVFSLYQYKSCTKTKPWNFLRLTTAFT